MYKVCLLGASFDTGNQGVSALGASLLGLISRCKPEAQFCLFIGARNPETREIEISGQKIKYKIINHRLSPRAPAREHLLFIFGMACLQRFVPSSFFKDRIVKAVRALRVLKEADFVGDIRGGDGFSDTYGLRRMITGSIPSIIVLLLGKPINLLPQTYGPYRSRIARWIAKWILSRGAIVLARDEEGVELVKDLLGRSQADNNILFCPDVAFSMKGKAASNPSITPPLSRCISGGTLVGLNINGLLFNGGYSRDNMFGLRFNYRDFVKKLAEQILTRTSGHLFLIPHTFTRPGHVESDSEACRAVFETLKCYYHNRIHLLEGTYDMFEIKGIIGGCNFFVGSRMHACIGALSQGIPTIGIAYSKKFKGVFQSIGMEDMVLDGRTLDIEEAISKVFHAFERREIISRVLSKNILETHKKLESTFRSLLNTSAP